MIDGPNHGPKRLKQTHLFTAPPQAWDEVVATIYSWTFNPPFDHILKGISYFGQTKQTLRERTSQHKNMAIQIPKELGLHALWRLYPYDDHWVIQTLDTRRFVNTVDALDWMNEEEMKLIDAHGGILRNMDRKLKQTLNLTRGGQGDPRKMWEGIKAHSRRKLNKIWPKFEAWYEKNKHLRIPRKDPELGNVVNNIRNHKSFLHHVDFKAWLDERGFVYDEHRAHLERAHLELEIWPKLKTWYEDKKHLRIPQKDPELGNVVNNIRNNKCFLQYADFAMWLWCACFEMHTKDPHLNRERWSQVFS